MFLVVRQLLLRRAVERAAIDVEAAVLLAEVVKAASVGCPDRVAVFALEGGELLVGAVGGGEVAEPDVARDGRLMVLAPRVFIPLHVVVKQAVALRTEREALHGEGGVELGASAVETDAVNLRELPRGELAVHAVGLDAGRVEDAAVGRDCLRIFGGRMGGQPAGDAAVAAHGVDTEVAVAVGGEDDLSAVGRPHGARVVGRVGGQLHGASTFGGYGVDVALVGEGDGFPVGGDGRVAHP